MEYRTVKKSRGYRFRESDYAYVKEYDIAGNVMRYTYVFIEGIHPSPDQPTICKIQILGTDTKCNEYVHEEDLVHVTRKSQYWSTYFETYSVDVTSKRRTIQPSKEFLRSLKTRRNSTASQSSSDGENAARGDGNTSVPRQLLSDLDISPSEDEEESSITTTATVTVPATKASAQARSESPTAEEAIAVACNDTNSDNRPSCSIYAGQKRNPSTLAVRTDNEGDVGDLDDFDYHEFEIKERNEDMARLREMHKSEAERDEKDTVENTNESVVDEGENDRDKETELASQDRVEDSMEVSRLAEAKIQKPVDIGERDSVELNQKERVKESKLVSVVGDSAGPIESGAIGEGGKEESFNEVEKIASPSLTQTYEKNDKGAEGYEAGEMECVEKDVEELEEGENMDMDYEEELWNDEDHDHDHDHELLNGIGETDESTPELTPNHKTNNNNNIAKGILKTKGQKPPDSDYVIRVIVNGSMKDRLEADQDLIKRHGKLVHLPARVSVLQILENWVKFSVIKLIFKWAQRNCNGEEEAMEKNDRDLQEIRRETNLIKEVADGLRICFDFYINQILYEQEEKQREYVLSDEFRRDFTYVIAPDFLNPEVEVEELITRSRLEELHAERVRAHAQAEAKAKEKTPEEVVKGKKTPVEPAIEQDDRQTDDASEGETPDEEMKNLPIDPRNPLNLDISMDDEGEGEDEFVDVEKVSPKREEPASTTPAKSDHFLSLTTTPVASSRRSSFADIDIGDAHSIDSANNDASSIEEALRAVDSISPTEEEDELPHMAFSPMPQEDLFRYDDDTNALFDVNTDFDMYFSDLCVSSDDALSHYSTEEVVTRVQNCLSKRSSQRRSKGSTSTVYQPLEYKIAVAYRNYVVLMEKLKLKIPEIFKEFLEKELAFQMIPSTAIFMPSMIYGPIHMARMLIIMPRVLQAQQHSEERLKILLRLIEDFTKYLTLRRNWFSSDDYYDDPHEWFGAKNEEAMAQEKVIKTHTVWRRRAASETKITTENHTKPPDHPRPGRTSGPVVVPDEAMISGEVPIPAVALSSKKIPNGASSAAAAEVAAIPHADPRNCRKRSSDDESKHQKSNSKETRLTPTTTATSMITTTTTATTTATATTITTTAPTTTKAFASAKGSPRPLAALIRSATITSSDCDTPPPLPPRSDSSASCSSSSSSRKHKKKKKKSEKPERNDNANDSVDSGSGERVKYRIVASVKPETAERVSPIKISKIDGMMTMAAAVKTSEAALDTTTLPTSMGRTAACVPAQLIMTTTSKAAAVAATGASSKPSVTGSAQEKSKTHSRS